MNVFDTVWSELQEKLKEGATIKNWTAFRGYLGDTMTVVGVRDNYIEVESPNAGSIQVVPQKDFRKVWEVWAGYKSQRVRRYELTPITRYSKYIISILNWNENV